MFALRSVKRLTDRKKKIYIVKEKCYKHKFRLGIDEIDDGLSDYF